jgi:predicted AAA+ superfamily ATPase
MYIPRILQLNELLDKKSFFLFGPRSTGKSYLIRRQLPDARVYNLLENSVLRDLSKNPGLIAERQSDWSQIIVVDEIQLLPVLLNEVHRLIEEKSARFLLTGSNAKKLRSGGVNLLAGRAWSAELFPVTFGEFFKPDQLADILLYGGLPSVVLSADKFEELNAYTGTYLEQEIRSEAAVRDIGLFATFLDICAAKVAEEVNYNSIASDLGVSPPTVNNYFQLLEDTLLGFRLHPFSKTKKRKSTSRPKFYFFDLGVTSSLIKRREIVDGTAAYGDAFEHFIALELRAYLSYTRNTEKLAFWRSQSGFEVDFTIGDHTAIEVKADKKPSKASLKGLKALKEEGIFESFFLVCRESEARVVDGISVLPWQEFLDLLWKGKIFRPGVRGLAGGV